MLEPGGLFRSHLFTDVHRVPFYNIAEGYSFNFYDLFIILAFIKAIIKGKKTNFLFNKPLSLLFYYLIFLLLMGLVYGLNLENIIYYSRFLSTFSLFISFPYLVYKKGDVFHFIHLLLPIVFIVLVGQIFDIFTGKDLESLFLAPQTISAVSLAQLSSYEYTLRATRLSGIEVYFCFIFSIFFLTKKDYVGSRFYLYLIFSISILSLLMTGVRSWIIMIAIFLILYSLFVSKRRVNIFLQLALVLTIFFILSYFFPRIYSSVLYSIKRLSTVEYLIKGDLTAGRTLERITIRLPKVLKKFKEKPIFGWGFSDMYRRWGDHHVGNFNLLMQCGIFGFMFFLNFWISFYNMISECRKRLSEGNSLKQPLVVLIIAFIGMLILHFTSYQFFGFDLRQSHIFFIVAFISFSGFFIKEAEKRELLRSNLARK
ncbi:MAG: O-antigen ligase family protein [Candidatus Hodarchaeota archaeon]